MTQRIAAYCRVSTDSSDQANSLASQERFFRDYIASNPCWELVQVYVDTGITGTSTRRRTAFMQMIAHAAAGSFNMIITKEISRFARNTLDSIYYTRKLKEYGVGVIFLNDNINTLDADAELRLTIMSSIAQEESRKTSERVKWGQKRSMEQGVVFGRDMLGYDLRGGKLYINEQGAKAVQLIFHKFVNEGKGSHIIARELREEGIPTSPYMKQWSHTAVLRILRNEKLAGDLVQKKTITENYLTHKKKYNRGQEELVIIPNHHQPIIDRRLFDLAQQELMRRSPSGVHNAKHSNRYCFSGKIKCAVCGSSFVSRSKKRKDGSIYKAWRCGKAAKEGAEHTHHIGEALGCSCPCVNDRELQAVMAKIAALLPIDKSKIAKAVGRAVSQSLQCPVATGGDITKQVAVLERKRQRLLELYLAEDITKAEFVEMKAQWERCAGIGQQQTEPSAPAQASPDEIADFTAKAICGQVWSESFYRNLLERITVDRDGRLTIRLRSLPYGWQAVPEAGSGSTSVPQYRYR